MGLGSWWTGTRERVSSWWTDNSARSHSSSIAVNLSRFIFFFFFNDTAPTEISPLSLPDALPISTGAIARTATNVKSGARTPVAGIVHAITLLAIILVAAPLAKFIPLAALSAVLVNVAI